jgi:hypothetical protein
MTAQTSPGPQTDLQPQPCWAISRRKRLPVRPAKHHSPVWLTICKSQMFPGRAPNGTHGRGCRSCSHQSQAGQRTSIHQRQQHPGYHLSGPLRKRGSLARPQGSPTSSPRWTCKIPTAVRLPVTVLSTRVVSTELTARSTFWAALLRW